MRIALVHDYLNEAGGAERVLRVLADMYPEAPIYTAFAKNGTARKMFLDRKIVESPWAGLLKIGRMYSYFRFLLPLIWRSIDLSTYDLVITSTSGGYIARGFRVQKSAKVIAYCHTVPKWLYGYETPTGAMKTWWGKAYLWIFGPFVRYFDYVSAQRVDTWIANSHEVAKRIKKFYRRDAVVMYPPVELPSDQPLAPRVDTPYYLAVARITGAKGLLEAGRAAQSLGLTLVVAGEIVEKSTAQELKELEPAVISTGRVTDQELVSLYAHAKAYIALARDEDFGMTVVEAMRCGTPVLALRSGGYKETVIPGETGVLIESTDTGSIKNGLETLEKQKLKKDEIVRWAKRFNRKTFEDGIRSVVHA